MSESYHTESAAGFRHDDPMVDIQWPVDRKIVSEKDGALPLLASLS